jgi:hypothetical protein
MLRTASGLACDNSTLLDHEISGLAMHSLTRGTILHNARYNSAQLSTQLAYIIAIREHMLRLVFE